MSWPVWLLYVVGLYGFLASLSVLAIKDAKERKEEVRLHLQLFTGGQLSELRITDGKRVTLEISRRCKRLAEVIF